MHILLASSSPRRQALLAQLDLPCRIEIPRVDEEGLLASMMAGRGPSLELARDVAAALARAKAEEVAGRLGAVEGRCLVLAADTMVVSEGEVLNKPSDPADARRMLRLLSGRTHHVVSGLCALWLEPSSAPCVRAEAETTAVTFRDLSDDLIEAYVQSGEPLDKAGAYGIQGLGATLVRRVDGCYFNVVGLPVALLIDMLDRMGHPVQTFWR